MSWEHKCSLDWLQQRQHYLTASDIKSLLPVTKTGRKREVGDQEYLKVMASKMVTLTEEDCMSYGAMARGHIMEPYAIDALNKMLRMENGQEAEQFHWWDDNLVVKANRAIGFSPDGMDVPMNGDSTLVPTAIAEVKSYDAVRHLSVAYTPKELIEERWQIACAMALLDSIDHAYLVLFNPKMKYRKTFVIRFDRNELLSEIDTILQIEERWKVFRSEVGPLRNTPPSGAIWSSVGGSEEDIVNEYEASRGVNPV